MRNHRQANPGRSEVSPRTLSSLLALTPGLLGVVLLGLLGCSQEPLSARVTTPFAGKIGIRGAWLAPRQGYRLDGPAGDEALAHLHSVGVRHVAFGHVVKMPALKEPELTWGDEAGDEALVGALRRCKAAGLARFVLPRIESPDFFEPPYPFRADIKFDTAAEWDRFHDSMQAMILHYAKLAEAEGVEIFGLGLETKHSVRGFADRWTQIIREVRKVYGGKITYSANWYDEWREITFWKEFDYIGVGAYFELHGDAPGTATVKELVGRWQPIVADLTALSQRVDRPVLFTEVGYTGYVDCAERPWEWAGKTEKGVAIDHFAQARAIEALLEVVGSHEQIAGLFLWTYYTDARRVADWEYGLQGRPAEAEVRRAFAPR